MVYKKESNGFTIVELLVVIVVIGILAAITIVSYTGISNKATAASLQSDLTNASQQFKMFQIDNNNYPTTIDCAQADSVTNKCIKSSSNTNFQLAVNNNVKPQTFSLYATKSNIKYRITNDSNPISVTPVVASGGVVTDANSYRTHTFTSSGTFTVTSGDDVEVLVVAGGGGGASSVLSSGGGGGGGGGGVVYNPSFAISAGQVLTVTIGNGGAAGATSAGQSGLSGGNSVFGSIVAIGGGYGGTNGYNGGAGGSGGGAGYNGYSIVRSGGVATTGQGYNGGNTSLLPWAGGAGGGGAGGIGGDNKINHGGGDKGVGLANSISGASVVYASGGSGGSNNPAASLANTGKGGDAAYSTAVAYAGGSGIVIVRYPN